MSGELRDFRVRFYIWIKKLYSINENAKKSIIAILDFVICPGFHPRDERCPFVFPEVLVRIVHVHPDALQK